MPVIYRTRNITARRLDPWHYQPAFESVINKVKSLSSWSELGDVIDSERSISGGATPLGAEYSQHGRIRFYRTSEITDCYLDTECVVFISEEQDKNLQRSRLISGDVLLTITGAHFGKSAVVEEKHLPGNISQHAVRFHFDEEIDSYFIVAYLNSSIGQVVIWKAAYGATRPAIDYSGIRSLILPTVRKKSQTYIGNKVRQAEWMREWAQSISKELTTLLKPFNPESLPNGRTDRVTAENLLTETLNPNSYMPRFIEAERIVYSNRNVLLQDLCKSVVDGPFGSNLKVTDYTIGGAAKHPVLRVKNCLNGQLIRDDLVWINEKKHQELKRSEVLSGDLLITKAGRIGSSAVYPSDLPPGNITSHLVRARVKESQINPEYLAQFFETVVGRAITERHSFKSTRPELTRDEIARCPVGMLDEASMERVADLARNRTIATNFSTTLTLAAKLLVESLIEGHLTESELEAAQQALENGDNSLDKAILARLTAKGIDIEGEPPLFPDLDALYQLLAEAEAATDKDTVAESTDEQAYATS